MVGVGLRGRGGFPGLRIEPVLQAGSAFAGADRGSAGGGAAG